LSFNSLAVRGTPTLILADSKGVVEQYWEGRQDERGEKSVLEAVEQK
jgi:hypothetical protein